jgi:hypothetical protein
MATTTNYNWSTPDDTSLVKDGAAAIRTLGSSIDTTTKALNPSTTLGDIEYRSSTANTNTRLGIGSTGNVLTVSGGVPVWAAPAGGGKVLQVVAATYSTSQTSTSSSYVDTGLTATITPSSASSKILAIVNHNACKSDGGGIALKLRRASTDIITFSFYGGAGPAAVDIGSIGTAYLDEPSTTSATTYKTMFANQIPANSCTLQNGGLATSTIVLLEIGA